MATEKRLIDANALKWKLGQVTLYVPWLRFGKTATIKVLEAYRRGVFEEIDNAPTVEAVEVVRCKECKSWEQYNACDGTKPHRCMNHDAIFHKRTAPDDFCSYGERRTK